jgi:hypothetical protein
MRPRRSSHPTFLLALVQWAFLVSALSMITGVAAVAQIDRAVLEGTVTDPTGAAIVGARVKTLAVDTGITQEKATNSKGYYRFPGLAVGRYRVPSIRLS